MFDLRHKQGFFNRHTSLNAGLQGASVDTSFSSPLSKRLFSAVKRIAFDVSLIVVLLFACSPLAVFRRVAERVVFAFYRHTIRLFAHIGEERLKRILPTITNGNPSSTIIGERLATRIVTSLFYMFPNAIGRRSVHTVGDVEGFVMLTHTTSATHFLTGSEPSGIALGFRAALAKAKPFRLPVWVASKIANYGQAMKRLTDQINEITSNFLNCHSIIIPQMGVRYGE